MSACSRRSLARVAATGFVLTVAGVSAGAGDPAFASPAAAARFSAGSSAGLLRVAAIGGDLLGAETLGSATVASTRCAADSARSPHTAATASHLAVTAVTADTGPAVGGALGGSGAIPEAAASLNTAGQVITPLSVRQTAGPDHRTAVLSDAAAQDLGLAKVGIGRLRAHARWNPALVRSAAPAMLSEAAAALANLTLIPSTALPVPAPFLGTSAAHVHTTGYSQCRNGLVAVDGQRALGVAATARVSAIAVTLFGGSAQQHTVRVISPPSLQVVAAGSRRSSVRYISPILEVLDGSGNAHRIDAPGQTIDVPLATIPEPHAPSSLLPGGGGLVTPPSGGLPALPGTRDLTTAALGGGGGGSAGGSVLRLSLGSLAERISDTSVSADVATIRLDVLPVAGGAPLLSMGIGELHATATAPKGGVPSGGGSGEDDPGAVAHDPGRDVSGDTPGGGSDGGQPTKVPGTNQAAAAGGPTPGEGAAHSGSLPITGSGLGLVLAAGVAMVLAGRFAVLFARRSR
ncbi:MAG: hypothetical protein QOD41_4491 [Cryptosporangiaceae bacterium]|nr:hypothetical protein [Cryptosporangiaceae bacterium]